MVRINGTVLGSWYSPEFCISACSGWLALPSDKWNLCSSLKLLGDGKWACLGGEEGDIFAMIPQSNAKEGVLCVLLVLHYRLAENMPLILGGGEAVWLLFPAGFPWCRIGDAALVHRLSSL